MDSLTVDETRSHGSDDGCASTKIETGPQSKEWFDAGAMSCHQMLHTDLAQPICRPAKGLVICTVQVHPPHECMNRLVLNRRLYVFQQIDSA